MARHVYLDPSGPLRAPRRRVQFVVAWIALLALFVASWQRAQLEPTLAPLVFAGLAGLLAAIIALAVALKRGKFEDVVAILDGERALLRNALAQNDAVLSEAMRAYALSRLGDAYRAAARTTAPIDADDLARAYVRSMLPEVEPVLAHH